MQALTSKLAALACAVMISGAVLCVSGHWEPLTIVAMSYWFLSLGPVCSFGLDLMCTFRPLPGDERC